jgi:hypothetical protein
MALPARLYLSGPQPEALTWHWFSMIIFNAQTKTQIPRGKHWTRRSHRVIAIGALVFLIMMAVTGLILNHADALGLSHRPASSALVSRLYGIEAPPIDMAYEASGITFVTAAGTLYADGDVVANDTGKLRGAVVSSDVIVVATDRELFVTTTGAALIERSEKLLQQPMIDLGSGGHRVIVALHDRQLEFDSQQMSLSEFDTPVGDIKWSEPVSLSDDQLLQIGNAALGQSINWERLLIDVHSGRILPTVGRYIADITALCLLYLCMSGVALWFRRR